MERYSKTDKIGTGAYGVVYKAYDTLSRKHVALKKIRLEVEDEGIPASALREFSYLKMLQLIRHPNIVFLENVTFSSNRLYLAFELMEGDLKRLMDTYPNRFDADLVQSYTSQIFDGLAYMHSLGVMHRDLKPQNLLVSRDGCIKIADFGLARSALPKKRALSIEVITRWYRPPEILLGGDVYSSAVDVWSVGCIIAEMSNMRPLFPSDSEIDQIHRIFRLLGTPSDEVWPQFSSMPLYRNSYPNWQKIHLSIVVPRLSTDAVNLLERIFQYDSSSRISAKDALSHPYARPADGCTHTGIVLSPANPFTPPNSRTRTSAVSNTEGSTSSADSSGGSCAPGTSSSFSSSRRPPVVPIVNPRPHVRSVLPSNGTENDGSGKEEPHSTEESHEDHVKADDSQNDDSAQCGVEAEESLTDDRRPCQSTSAASKKRTRRK